MDHGTYMEGVPLSDITIRIYLPTKIRHLKVEVKEDAEHVGGCTLWQGVWELRSGYQTENVL